MSFDEFLSQAGGTRIRKFEWAITIIPITSFVWTGMVRNEAWGDCHERGDCLPKPPADGFEFHDWKIHEREGVVICWKRMLP